MIEQVENNERSEFKRQFAYRLSAFDETDIKGYVEEECSYIDSNTEELINKLRILTITENDLLTPDQINEKLEGDFENMSTINKEGTTYVGNITKQLVEKNSQINELKDMPTARQQVFNELLINAELPNSLRSIISITDDEHVETIPGLTYIKEKLNTTGIELNLINNSRYFHNREGLIFFEISDTVIHGTDKILDEILKEILIKETINYESILLLDKNNSTGLIDDKNKDLSLYNQEIKQLNDSSYYEGIRKTVKDIPQSFRHDVSIVMNTDHYNSLIKELSQLGLGSLAIDLPKLFNITNVVVNDYAHDIFIGDFKHGIYAKYRAVRYNQKKNANDGVYQMSLHYAFDIKIVSSLLRMLTIN